MLAQAVDTQVSPACRHAVGHQLQPGIIVIDGQRQYADLRHRSQAQQYPRDLCRLDAIAAHFDLIVSPADEFQQALMSAAHAVAAAVDARAILRERVRHEALGGQRGLADIAQRHAVAADVQLAGNLSAHRVQHVVQHISTGPWQRCADWHAAQRVANVHPSGYTCILWERHQHLISQHTNGGFARPVVVDHPATRLELTHLLDQHGRAGFAADNQRMLRQYVGWLAGLQQRGQMTGDDFQHAHLMLGHVGREGIRIKTQRLGQHMQRASRTQRAEQHGMAEVGGDGRDQRHACLGGQLQLFQQAAQVTGQRTLADQHPFWLAGRAGGMNHVGRRIG
ncbi:Uncharacterized protein AC517_2423 [Pseudomonas syringae pv. syringae]|nr:Uncharacterized protein AC517_2423 [Pseudomonas syringae pv. syringae]